MQWDAFSPRNASQCRSVRQKYTPQPSTEDTLILVVRFFLDYQWTSSCVMKILFGRKKRPEKIPGRSESPIAVS